MKYIEFYEQCMATGKMPDSGLCFALPPELNGEILDMVKPTIEDREVLRNEGSPVNYWGNESYANRLSSFTPLRQTLVLLMAAIAGEFDN